MQQRGSSILRNSNKTREAVNQTGPTGLEVIEGLESFMKRILTKELAKTGGVTRTVAFDGFPLTDWDTIIESASYHLRNSGIYYRVFRSDTLKDPNKISMIERECLGEDPVFGRVCRKPISHFFSSEKLSELKRELSKIRLCRELDLVIVAGTGSAIRELRDEYDTIVYFDITREEALSRLRASGSSISTQSIGPKNLYYIEFPVSEIHRRRLLKWLDYYVDCNRNKPPLALSGRDLKKLASSVATLPFRLKPIYEPGPWGGQWLKEIRKLPQNWPNCAWSYEVIAPEMSLLVNIEDHVIELPWNLFFDLSHREVMGSISRRRFGDEFPVRFDYLDTMDGGDLSIQVHPGSAYIKKNFNEKFQQGEMYYIVDCKIGKSVNIGLKTREGLKRFKEAAEKAESDGIAFDYSEFVNNIPVSKHDIVMIPPGTVHGSREGLVVLEISATTYRYTFKIYDHLRPDLAGKMRPLHTDHAFRVIRPYRCKEWVENHLVQEPELLYSSEECSEYVIARSPEFFHQVNRIEISGHAVFETGGRFHILTLVEGDSIEIRAGERIFTLKYSETIIVPAAAKSYSVVTRGNERCKIVKAFLK